MKSEVFPLRITDLGVSATIRRFTQTKNGTEYTSYMVEYFLLEKRQQKWISALAMARAYAYDICQKVALGEQYSLELKK